MKTYKGYVRPGQVASIFIMVHEDDKPPYELKHIKRHSTTGLTWGYGGSGPADTALSILVDCVGADKAYGIYDFFKSDHVATWKLTTGLCFEITSDEIIQWMNDNIIGLENGNPRRREHGETKKACRGQEAEGLSKSQTGGLVEG